MTPKLDSILDDLRGAWRFRWRALAVAAAIALAGWLVIFALPDKYEAQSSVLVNTRTALQPALKGIAVNADVSGELNYVRQALLSDPQLSGLAERAGILPASGLSPERRQARLEAISERIDITAEQDQSLPGPAQKNGNTTYDITYEDADPARALALVRLLTRNLVTETLGGTRQGSVHAQAFLRTQIASYAKRLQEAEDRLAAFKSQHSGLIPGEQGGYFEQLEHESQSIERLKTKLLVARSRHVELEKELHGDAAISSMDAMPVLGPNGTVVGGDTQTQIEVVQAHLNQLLLKYTSKYPDVIAARQELAELKQRRAQELAALKRGDASAAALSGASSNPIYQGIELSLNKVDVDIADLHAELAQRERKERELRKLLDSTPQLQAQYAQLSRDYQINKKQYAALLASYDKARLGEQAGNAGAVRFEMVQPPTVSFTPVSPKRGELLLLVLVLALGAGAVLAHWLNQQRPVVGSPSGLRELTGIPVVVVVGPAFPTRSRRLARMEVRRFAFVFGCLLLAFIVAVVLSHLGVRLGGAASAPTVQA